MRFQEPERTGAAIRKLRLAKGLTLAELAEQSGVPISTLSRVELGQNRLNTDKLMRLCRALDVDMSGLVTRQADSVSIPSGRRSVARVGQGEPVRLGAGDGRVAASDLLDKSFTPVTLTLKAASLDDHGPMITLPGEAYLLALVGQVVLHSQHYAPLVLAPGDGVYFDGRSPYALLAGDENGATALLVAAGDHTLKT